MTKHYEEKTETVKKKVFLKMTCDLCGRESTRYGHWSGNLFTIDETEISYRSGNSYPEGGSAEEISIDICPDCFTKKLIPFLESEGAKSQFTDSDW